ncbi:MAG: hypothetical protein HW390_1020 [Candidatus Brocadiaceae bacterium]|nr:hypothetical protein [Candidatus Brocadiaceae bacterium]
MVLKILVCAVNIRCNRLVCRWLTNTRSLYKTVLEIEELCGGEAIKKIK